MTPALASARVAFTTLERTARHLRTRGDCRDALGELNRMKLDEFGDPEIATRIAQYEMAFRMQSSVPELTDLSAEPEQVFDLYGEDARKPGTFAANCLLARRLAERGVRFIQLFHRGWDQHGALPKDIKKQCAATDQASAALVRDLKERGLLEDTLLVWGGEFGRTPMNEARNGSKFLGRDHHPRGRAHPRLLPPQRQRAHDRRARRDRDRLRRAGLRGRRHAQLIRHDLGKGRLRSLPVGRNPGVYQNAA